MGGYEKTHRPEADLEKRPEHGMPGAERADAERSAAEPDVSRQAQLWRQLGADAPPATPEDAATLAVERKGSGAPVDAGLAAEVGSHVGADLSAARVHSDPLSQHATRAMQARAFAHGTDVFLGPGESATDKQLMGHELTHVAQQTGGVQLPQRKLAVGAANSPAEQQADQVGAAAAAGALTPSLLLVDAPPLGPGQMLKSVFVQRLRELVVATADHELGRIGSAAACPYIAQYFARYGGEPARTGEALLKRWIPAARTAMSADDLIPLVLGRVRDGVRSWRETGKAPADLAAAEPDLAAQAESASPTAAQRAPADGAPEADAAGAAGAAPGSLAALETELGPGQPLDGGTAAKMSSALGSDVSAARIHTGPAAAAKAAEHDATAFAVGRNVVMGSAAPAAGTPAGDALLAHELAHTAQQQDAAADPAARKKPIGEEDAAAERDANRLAALGNFAGAVGDVMRTGLQLQRCPADWEETPDLEERLGLSIDIAPAAPEGKSYIVGQKIDLSLGQKTAGEHMVVVYRWEATDERGNTMVTNGEKVNFQIFWPGATKIRAKVGMPGGDTIEWAWLERTIQAERATKRAEDLTAAAPEPTGFQTFRAMQDVNLALLSPDNTPSPDQAAFIKGGANPVKTDASGSVHYDVGYPAGTTEPAGRTFKWYAHPLQSKDAPAKLGSAPKTTLDGREVYDLGSGRSADLSTSTKGVYVVGCQLFDAGRKAAEATFVQSVLDAKEIEAVGDIKKHMAAVDGKLGGLVKNAKGDPDLVPVTAFHVDATSGTETQLSMFVGKRADGELVMLNATPGLKLTEHRIEFTASSSSGLLDDFDSNNKYPPGAVRFHIPGGKLAGVDAADRTITTTGDTTLGHIAGALGMAALVLSVAAIPFTGGASATATVLFVGAAATGVAAGAFSLADHLKNEDFTTGQIALDCLQIAASFIDLGAGIQALRTSPALVVANKAVRYAMWGNLAMQGASAILISVEAISQLEAILGDDKLSRADKIKALTKLLATLIVTGGLLAISYKSMGEAKARMKDIFGAKGSALKDLDAAALSLVDDTVLKTLRAAEGTHLEQLAAMIRKDPALVTRLPGRKNVLGALKKVKGNEPNDLELELFMSKLSEAGVPGKNVARIREALAAGNIDAATAHLLTTDDLLRLKKADDALAGVRTLPDGDPKKTAALETAKTELDGVTGVAPGSRDQLRAAIAHVNGMPDPAFTIDPVAALKAKFPKLPPGDLAVLGTLHKDALLALEDATLDDVKKIIARLKGGSTADASEILRSYFYKSRKPARKTGDPYAPPERVGTRLETSLDNLAAARAQKFPHGFADEAAYQKFLATVTGSLTRRKIPSTDVRVHGSALHSKTPGDIDVAVIVDAKTFDELGARFGEAAKKAGDAKGAKTLAGDLAKGKIASANFYPDVSPPVAIEAKAAAPLDVQVSVIRSGSEFDIGPYMTP